MIKREFLIQIHSFTRGEAVTIHEDFNAVRELQDGHGGWNDRMKPVTISFEFLSNKM